MPFEAVLRVWDIVMLEGLKTVFRIGIALLARREEELLQLTRRTSLICVAWIDRVYPQLLYAAA